MQDELKELQDKVRDLEKWQNELLSKLSDNSADTTRNEIMRDATKIFDYNRELRIENELLIKTGLDLAREIEELKEQIRKDRREKELDGRRSMTDTW